MTYAREMFDKARDLYLAADLLHRSHHDHAALICAIHSGINSADAIGQVEADPFRGTEHKAAADHLRKLDPRLALPAKALRRLASRKSSAEYREARYTRNQIADAIVDARLLLDVAATWLDTDTGIDSKDGSFNDLIGELELAASRASMNLSAAPWQTIIAILEALSGCGTSVDQILAGE